MRAIHVVWIDLDAILVHEKLSQHRLLASNTNWRCRGCRTCFDEHTLFKALFLVLASSVTAVLDYNSPKCHKIIILCKTICRMLNPYSKCSKYSIFLFPISRFHVIGNNKNGLVFNKPISQKCLQIRRRPQYLRRSKAKPANLIPDITSTFFCIIRHSSIP